MRRKSTRNAQKASPEKASKESEVTPKTRRSRRRRRSPSKSSDSEEEVLTVTKRAPPASETPDTTTKSHSPSDAEEASQEPVWKVTSSEDTPKGEIQKLKICLRRPVSESPDKSKKSKSGSQTEDDATSSEDRTSRSRRTRSRGSPFVSNDGLSSQEVDDESEEKKGKGKSKGKHKSKIEKSPHINDPQIQPNNEISGNVQVTPQSPSIDKPVDNENDNNKVGVDDTQSVTESADAIGKIDENVVSENSHAQNNDSDDDDEPLSIIKKQTVEETVTNTIQPVSESAIQETAAKDNKSTVSENTAPETIAKETVSVESTAKDTVSKESTAKHTASEESIVKKIVSEESTAKATISEESTAKEIVSEESIAKEIVPEESIAKEIVSEESSTKETVSEESIAKEVVSKESSAKVTVSEESAAKVTVSEESPAKETVSEDISAKETIAEETPSEEAVQQDAPKAVVAVAEKPKIAPETAKEVIQQESSEENEQSQPEEVNNDNLEEKDAKIADKTPIDDKIETTSQDLTAVEAKDAEEVEIAEPEVQTSEESVVNSTIPEEKTTIQETENEKPVGTPIRKWLKRDRSPPPPLSSETAPLKTPQKRPHWSTASEPLPSLLPIIKLETIELVCPKIEYPEEPDLKIEMPSPPKERRKSEAAPIKMERKVSVQSDTSDKPFYESQTSVESVTNENETNAANIIAFNRKISIVDDTASKLKPPPSPAKNPIAEVLFITNLVRPFTLKQLKELLERTGQIKEEGFWTDRIKSKCYVQYETSEEAESTRNALHGVQWPIGNGKKLIIDYASVEDFQTAKNPPAPAPVTEVVVPVSEKVPTEKRKSEERVREEPLEKKRNEGPVREWDIGKKDLDRARSRSRERGRKHRRSQSPAEDFIARKQRKEEEVLPQKLMDDLFLKTKATPSIYWQPLSPEEISMKQQQRLVRMEEHKRRMEENTRMKGREAGRGGFRRRYD